MNVTANQILWPVLSGVIVVLFSGNLYFAKRTIDRLDSIEQLTWSLRQEVAVLRATLQPIRSPYSRGRTYNGLVHKTPLGLPGAQHERVGMPLE